MMGLSTSGSISLGWALVAGRKRVPSPAAGKTALRTRMVNFDCTFCDCRLTNGNQESDHHRGHRGNPGTTTPKDAKLHEGKAAQLGDRIETECAVYPSGAC